MLRQLRAQTLRWHYVDCITISRWCRFQVLWQIWSAGVMDGRVIWSQGLYRISVVYKTQYLLYVYRELKKNSQLWRVALRQWVHVEVFRIPYHQKCSVMHNCVLKISYTFSVVVHFRSLSHYFDNQNWSEMPKRGNHIAVAFTIRRRAIRLVQGYSCGKCHTLCVAYTRRVSYIQVILCVSSKARSLAYREEVLQSCHFVLFISTNTVE